MLITTLQRLLLHNLAQPLTTIQVNCELALESLSSEQFALKRRLELINQGSHLLKQALTTEQENDYFALRQALRTAILYISLEQPRAVFSFHDYLDAESQIRGNQLLLQQVLIALLKNALEAYPARVNKQLISIWVERSQKQSRISICDGGCGLTWWQQQLAFKKGFTLKNKHQGLGLYLCQKVIRDSFQGEIKLLSRKNKGCTVQCFLPLAIKPGNNPSL